MGERVERSELNVRHTADVRRRLEDSVAALAAMVDQGCFARHEDSVGTELELDLVDPLGRPRLVNDDVLTKLERPAQAGWRIWGFGSSRLAPCRRSARRS